MVEGDKGVRDETALHHLLAEESSRLVVGLKDESRSDVGLTSCEPMLYVPQWMPIECFARSNLWISTASGTLMCCGAMNSLQRTLSC
jgi:hypothetical protein